MELTCMNCLHVFEGSISKDSLGWHSVCPECGSSFDVDVADSLSDTNEMKEYCFNVSFGYGQYANGTYDVIAKNEDEAIGTALREICSKLYNALPDLDIEVSVELAESITINKRSCNQKI